MAVLVVVGPSLVAVAPARAATNTTINYQARILLSSGALVPDGFYHIEFKIYNDVSAGATAQGVCSGNCLWSETRTGVNTMRVVNGYVTANLGSVAAFPATMPWDQELFITMRVGGNGGSAVWDTEMTNSGNRMKITSVPYAFRAAQAFNVFSDPTSTASTNTNAIAIQTGNATGVTSNSGSISIDTGTATGTAGSINIGTANASGVSLGRSGTTTQILGATLNGTTSLLNFAANAPIGTAIATVDAGTSFVIPQTSVGIALTLPSPTNTTAGRVVYVANTGTTSFTLNGSTVSIGTGVAHIWNGTAWAVVGGGSGGATTIQQAYDNAVGGIITVTATDSTFRVRDAATTFGNTNVLSVQNNGGTIDYFGVQGDGDVSINTRLGIGTITPTASLQVTTATPTAVALAAGTAQINVSTFTGGIGGSTTIATTGTGGAGGSFSSTGGVGGTATAAATASTGGAGGSQILTGGAGGGAAVAGTGSNTGGAGGGLNFVAGTGGLASGATTGTNTGGNGGGVTLQAGTGGAATTGTGILNGGNGGTLTLRGGTGGVGTTGGGAGGAVSLQGGTAAAVAGASGGAATVTGAAGSTTGSGGAGGALSLTAGSAGGDNTVNRAGGAVTISAGASRGASAGGALTLNGGSGGSNLAVGSATGPASGGITINAGNGGIAPNATTLSVGGAAGGLTFNGGTGGAASVAGTGNNTGGAGGNSIFTGGNGGAANGATTGTNTGGTGGGYTFQGGTGGAATSGSGSLIGGAGGALTFSGGTGGLGTTSGGNGGGVTIQGGLAAAMAGATGGSVTIAGRAGSATGTGGNGGALALTGGAAGGNGTVARSGGSVTLTAGASNGGAAGGAVTLTAGAGGNNATAGTATGGNAGGITFNGSNGGVAANATVSSTGGSAGGFTVNGGTGGAASVAGTGSNTGGNGGAFVLGAGTGGVANGATTGINTGGVGGSLALTAGTGGAATTGTGTLQGGVGGNLTLSAGRGGAGTVSGAGGDIILQTSLNSAAQTEKLRVTGTGYVGIGTGTTTSLPNARLTVVAESNLLSQIKLRSARAAIVANDVIGGIDFDTNDTNLTAPGAVSARIRGVATASHGAATYDTAIVFSTASGVTLAERWRIGATGELQGNGASTIRANTGNLTLSTITSGNVVIDGAGTLEVQDNTNINSAQLTINSSQINAPQAIANDINGGNIGATAAATVDVDNAFILTQTTAGQTMTLFSPTNTAAGRLVYVTNSPSSTATFTLYGVTLAVGATQGYVWNGSAWTTFSASGAGGGVTIVGTFSGSSQTDGASIVGSTITFGPADATNPGMVTTGVQTLAGAKTFSSVLTVSAGGADLSSGGIVNTGAIAGATTITATGLLTSVGVNAGTGLVQGTGGLTVTGATLINTTGSANTGIGSSSGVLTITGSTASVFNIDGFTVDANEFNRLDGKDVALVDLNDAVNTAITGTGILTNGSISTGFGTISTTDTITGTTLNGTTGINSGSGAGTQRIDASGNLVNIGTITSGLINGQTISSSANFTGSLNVTTSTTLGGTLAVTGQSTFSSDLIGNGSATGTTGTATAIAGVNTTTINLTAAGAFANNDVIFVNNAGQDYYTRIVSGGGTTTLTVSPSVSYDASVTLTKYNVQNVGATSANYSNLNDRFYQGYFLGGVVVGAGSTTLSDGNLSRTAGDLVLTPGSGGIVNVNGTLNATAITGDGSAITNISSASITGSTITGLNASNISSGTISDSYLSANVALLNSSPTFTGSVTATGFSGSGSGITGLDASNISTGTLSDARLTSNVSLLSGVQTFSALKTFGAGAAITTGQSFTVNGDAFTDLTGTGLTITSGSLEVIYGSSAGSAVQGNTLVSVAAGTGLTGGGTITLGAGGTATLNVAYGSTSTTAVRGDTALTCASGNGNLAGGGNSITLGVGGTCGAITTNNAVSFSTSVTTPSILSAAALSIGSTGANAITIDTGSAAGITIGGTNADTLALGNATTATTINGATIVLGTSVVRRTAAGTTNYEFNDAADTTLNIRNTDVTGVANVTVEGAFTAASIAGSGSGISALDAGNVASGTLGDSRLSTNVATLSGAQSFSGAKTFTAGAVVSTGQTLTINGEAFSDLTGTGLIFSGGALAIDTTYFNANYIQLGAASVQADNSNNSSIAINKGLTATGNLLTLQKNSADVFTINNTGAVSISNTSTSAFTVSGSAVTFTVDTNGNIVRIGPAAADGNGTLFVLDTKNSAGDPAVGSETNAQYYSSTDGKTRCFENGVWSDCTTNRVLGEATLGAANGTITVNLAASTEYLQCRVDIKSRSTNSLVYMRFNGDAGGASYGWNTYSIVAAAVQDAQDASDSEIQLNGTTTGTVPFTADIKITNFADTRKAVDWTATGAEAIGTNMNRYSGGGAWGNTVNQVTSVSFVASGGTFAAGSHAWCEGRNVR